MPPPRVPRGHVRISCDDPRQAVTVRLGPEAVKYTGGFGGWQVIDRPGQVGMTLWQGQEPLQLQLGLMFEGLKGREPVGDQVLKLYRMARGDDESPPGVVRIQGVPLGADQWVIEGVEYGDPIRRPRDMYAIRQPIILTLREYVPPAFLNLRRRALAGSRGKTKIIRTKRGDTAATVARRYKCKWTDLRTLNLYNVRTAKQKFPTGTKLRVPVAQKKPKRKGGARGSDRGTAGRGRGND